MSKRENKSEVLKELLKDKVTTSNHEAMLQRYIVIIDETMRNWVKLEL